MPHKILVVSGGGARGAWGVGVASTLNKNNEGYQAVFGTSTGSLMAPFILLQEYETLKTFYSHVTQDSIFNQNPFNVHYDQVNNIVTTKLKTFKAIKRLLFGKKTFGETRNLYNMIKHDVSLDRYYKLVDDYDNNKLMLGIAVTNTHTGGFELKTNAGYTKTPHDWDSLCNWIWASANEPLLMSYTYVGRIAYVDGGVREVIPIESAIAYAISNPNIDSIDVIVNNSLIPESQNWDVNDGGIMNGLQRLLGIYNLSTVAYNENYSQLILDFYNFTAKVPVKPNNGLEFLNTLSNRNIHLRILCMPGEVAKEYPNELGFVSGVMKDLIKKGEAFGISPTQCLNGDINGQTLLQLSSLQYLY